MRSPVLGHLCHIWVAALPVASKIRNAPRLYRLTPRVIRHHLRLNYLLLLTYVIEKEQRYGVRIGILFEKHPVVRSTRYMLAEPYELSISLHVTLLHLLVRLLTAQISRFHIDGSHIDTANDANQGMRLRRNQKRIRIKISMNMGTNAKLKETRTVKGETTVSCSWSDSRGRSNFRVQRR